MFIIAGVGRKFVRGMRVDAPRPGTHLFVCLQLGQNFVPPLALSFAPVDRIAAAQPVDDVPRQRRRYLALAAIGEDRDPDAKVRHERHRSAPSDPTATMTDQSVTTIAVTSEAKAVVRFPELGESRLGVVNAWRVQLGDQRSRKQAFAVELALAQMKPHPVCEVDDRRVDRPGSGSPDRESQGPQPCVLVHHIGFGSIR